MFIPFNNDDTWEEDEDIDERSYWPCWIDPREVGYDYARKNVNFHFMVREQDMDATNLLLCTSFYETPVAYPKDRFRFHLKDSDYGEVIYITVNDMMDTVQSNFWRFRYAYWELLAKEGLKWIEATKKAE